MKQGNRLPCPYPNCNKTYSTGSGLSYHVQIKHGEGIPCPEKGCAMSFPGQFKVEKHRREVHRIFQCKYKACQRRLRDQASLDNHLRTHQQHKCTVVGCNQRFDTVKSLRKHRRVHDRPPREAAPSPSPRISVPPPVAVSGIPDAFTVTVLHTASLVDDIPDLLHSEDILFPSGSQVVDGVVQVGGEPAIPLGWVDTSAALTMMQKSNYRKILEHMCVIHSPLHEGKVCSECPSPITWREVMLSERKDRLYLSSNSMCQKCARAARLSKVKDHLGIDEDENVSQALVKRKFDKIAEDTFCAVCSRKLNLDNSHLVIGTTIKAPVRYAAYCRDCNNKRVALRSQNPMGKFRMWIASRLESFESRGTALSTIMTVALQGYCHGPAEYSAKEVFYLTKMAKEASPTCFWSGSELTVTSTADVCPTQKFTADRVVFRNGEALPYGAEEQILVASSEFANCVEQRIHYLDDLERNWDKGTAWADKVISDLRDGYDAEKEKKKPWSAEWRRRWLAFSSRKKEERVCWTKFEWRYMHEMCRGRSLVTGQLLDPKETHIDRVFNSDGYELTNCIVIEGGLNWAKRDMKEFKTSSTFTGPCKLEYGVRVLRDALKELIEGSRPRRQSWPGLIKAMRSDRYPWKELIPQGESAESANVEGRKRQGAEEGSEPPKVRKSRRIADS
ncbi:hypothetical protein BGX34_007304 [Mortierella sp. NVP85]|nr:hypothetical protein BGX34_007304 [Mortierella sp. NVP85]